ncbi:MAG: mechanosensitive ion channel family protein [Fidelibacterota bacterium]
MKEFFTQDFWQQLFINGKEWFVREAPSLILVFILLFASFRLVNMLVNSLRSALINRAAKKVNTDTGESEKRINTLVGIIKGLAKIILWTIFLMIILEKGGIDIGPILASAGILGVALGFGAQQLVRDYINGFFILLENQIRAGDVAIINGTGGLVERIELRTTTLRDFSGVVHIFQNGKIDSLANMTKEWSAVVLDIGVAYKENVEQVMQMMKEVGESMKNDEAYSSNILDPIEVFGLDKFADSALVIKARIKTKPGMQWSIGRAYRQKLKELFDEKNIEIPFPHTTVYWGEKIDPLKLDVSKQQ